MIEHLKFFLLRTVVGHRVIEAKSIGSRNCGNRGFQSKICPFKPNLMNHPGHADAMGGELVHFYTHFRSWNMGNTAMQSHQPTIVISRMARVFQPATHHPFSKGIEPTQPPIVIEVHIAGMNNFFDR